MRLKMIVLEYLIFSIRLHKYKDTNWFFVNLFMIVTNEISRFFYSNSGLY